MKISTNKPMKPLLNYLGSKAGIASELIRRMPPEAAESRVEVFAGAHALELALPRAKRQAILNDLDADVIGAAETVAGDAEGVMGHLRSLRSSQSTFNRIRDLRDGADWYELPTTQRAAYMIYLSRESVNANMRAFSLSTKRRSSFKPDRDLVPYAERYEGVTFTNMDWWTLLDKIVFKPKDVALFMFLDPPYVIADGRKHYRYNFDATDHLLLARALARINSLNDASRRNVKVMVTYDDDSDGLIRALYRPEFGWNLEVLEVAYDAGNGTVRNELIITNYAQSASDSGNHIDIARRGKEGPNA